MPAEPTKKATEQDRLPVSLKNALPKAIEAGRTLNKLNTQLIELHKELEEIKKKGAIPTARAFVVLRRFKDRMDETGKMFTAIFSAAAQRMVPEVFNEEGVSNIPLDEGFRVTTSEKLVANILKENRKAAIQWLRENGLGDIVDEALAISALDTKKRNQILAWIKKNNADDFLQEGVNWQTLSAAAKALIEQEAKELPEELFRVEWINNTSVTAIKGKSGSVR